MPSPSLVLELFPLSVFFEGCLDFNADVTLRYSANKSVSNILILKTC